MLYVCTEFDFNFKNRWKNPWLASAKLRSLAWDIPKAEERIVNRKIF